MLLIGLWVPSRALAQFSHGDFVQTGTEDTIGFSYPSLCRLEYQEVKDASEWPTASFNDDVCKVPGWLREIKDGMIGLVIPFNGGDCHATFGFSYSLDEASHQLVYHIYDYYGGCRAGGRYYVRFTQVPAPPEGYEVVVKEHFVERGVER